MPSIKAEDVINVLLKIDADKRNQVKEITLDMGKIVAATPAIMNRLTNSAT